MSKSWILLIVILIVTMFAVIGFEFYQSISGANSEFEKHVINLDIRSDLGTDVLDAIAILEPGLVIQDSQLDEGFPLFEEDDEEIPTDTDIFGEPVEDLRQGEVIDFSSPEAP